MEVYPVAQDREQYIATQIERSKAKFGYCKVSAGDALRYAGLIARHAATPGGPVVCLGTRNGREIDLFRHALHRPWAARMIRRFERPRAGVHSLVDGLLCPLGRSRLGAGQQVGDTDVVGVEINPMAERSDVWVGSFDDMPLIWERRFAAVYSNSFDQSQDPHRTAGEWKRIIRPGGLLIFAFSRGATASEHDPVGGLMLEDVRRLFGGELVYYERERSQVGYDEVLLRIGSGGE